MAHAAALLVGGVGLSVVHTPMVHAQTVAAATDGQGEAAVLPSTDVQADRFDAGTTQGTGSLTTSSTAAATGLPLSLRDTPQSVTVVTQQQIQDQNILTLEQALHNVVGVTVTNRDSERAYFYSRGFAIDNVQYDGVPTALSSSFYGGTTTDPILYDRIEIVRGATGLLTGAGNPGASINLVRKRADSKTLTGEASVSLGSWNQRRATFDLSTPLTEDGRIRARFVGMAQSTNAQLDFYHSNKRAFLATVEADLTPSTTLTVGYDYQEVKSTGVTWSGLPELFSDGTRTDWPTSKTMGTPWTYWNTTNQTAYVNLEKRFDNGWKAKANFAHHVNSFDAVIQYLYGNINKTTGEGLSLWQGRYGSDIQQNSLDLQATGPFRLLGRRHELVVGLNGSESSEFATNYTLHSTAAGNFYNWDGSLAEPDWGTGAKGGKDRTRQLGLYGAFRLSITDRLKLILGARESGWRDDTISASRRHTAFTPYTGAIYDVTEDYSVYASYTSIFQPQNYRDVNAQYLSPVTGKSYEVGVKGEHFGGRLNTSLGLFRIDQDNVATRDGTNLVAGSSDYAYVGTKGVTSRGFEAQVSGAPMEDWNVTAGISRTIARQASGAPYNTDLPTTEIRLFTTYRLPGALHALTIGAGFNWQNRVYSTITTTLAGKVMFVQKPVGIASLMARYDFTPKVSLQVNINNVFDRKYYTYVAAQGTYGNRANGMATLTFKL